MKICPDEPSRWPEMMKLIGTFYTLQMSLKTEIVDYNGPIHADPRCHAV